ncbi:MAG: type II secretion system protein E [Candidatus Gottesmanbacteria bacterium GW2011_GWA2_44_17]|uniref:Type II secretion system protein E n=3 Tax=Candidatus Gottesmaniibacteriota TaxID=1752720 RepID=A0A0G1IQM3_9BACT|nr:MAG: type II secretion system protein E [Microgenomates group bacterium GW2011_GWC1_43_11]KKT38000.1 MAG: type II secretion system protein E [Candidatus Gottesmanbacteria bacterium GW2011_GWB1_44_11c]KKT47727.1 MAG: type II secretion system protein E [Candidatus Gottesmanbacteria bacterium GW2011_GWA2_44_17]KKT61455.1 MAG: type II secretion system protein E [Candidatus Gottesmanbacteria bacterium GW2011_GWA1_44_24b]HCM82702.1 type II secretion system protein E [Patescibacteria group bacteriu
MAVTAQQILTTLVELGSITKEIADAVQSESLHSGEEPETILLRKHITTEEAILQAKAKLFHIPFISLATQAFSPDVISMIPESVARKYILMPFQYDEKQNTISVAMVDALDFQVIDFLEKKTGKTIAPYMGLKDDILAAMNNAYTQTIGADVSAALKETSTKEIKTYEAGHLGEVIREAPIAQIVSAILEQAMRLRASDVHIEPQELDTRVRYRVDGVLQERLLLPNRLHDAVISRIKILGDMKIDERRIPQDGRFNFKMGDAEVDLRVSSLPTVHGEKIVMRLLKKSGGVPTLPELGLRGLGLKNLEANILRPHGIILVTGPTGSGKTTTLYAVLTKLNNAKVNILTLEDPVEYQIAGVNQVQINPVAGLTFATGLRSFLRQDPNIMLVGEIRDRETTELAIQAALTGHLVFSTLHTNNAAGAIPRLIDLGAEPFLVVSALNAVVGQRIARKICPTCKEEYKPDEAVAKSVREVLGNLLEKDKEISLYRGKGTANNDPCSSCQGTGYLGRIGIFEVFTMTDPISRLTLSRSPMKDIENQAIQEGMITLKQDGYLKALEGTTSIEEVLRVAED